ncbi:hypothetical protein RclHR1_03020012 [Rhizophagus clarus]|uniref:Uncharacterized protein n=1 Tax=Rhizophagus clarus TaxID=94130 RepID=A0A2Z6RHT0_9GLOM|nr:hypothetical protein RclHR1_03020012 [Rhizophagus clarus]
MDRYFKGPDIPFERLDSIRRFRVTIFEGHLKVQTKPRLFEGLGRSISKAGLYLKSRGSCFLDVIVKGKWKNDEEESLLNKISKVYDFPDAF